MPQTRKSSNKVMGNRRGATFVDALMAAVIVSIAIVGLLQIFTYGQIKVDQIGIRRQALSALKGEMEQYRAQWIKSLGREYPLSRDVQRIVLANRDRKIDASILPEFQNGSESGLAYREVTLVIRYKVNNNYEDSLGLSARFYKE
jgi:hypothetical protein